MASIKDVFTLRESVTIRVDQYLWDELDSLRRSFREDPGPLVQMLDDAEEQMAPEGDENGITRDAQGEAHVQLSEKDAEELLQILRWHEEHLGHGGRRFPPELERLWDELTDQIDRIRTSHP
jgi:hypothetical protein